LATTRRFDFCRNVVTDQRNVVTDLGNIVINQWTRAGRNASECQADNGRETDPRGQDDCDYHEQNESTVRASQISTSKAALENRLRKRTEHKEKLPGSSASRLETAQLSNSEDITSTW